MKHTRNFLRYVFAEADIVEMRIKLDDDSIVAGRFDDLDRLAAMAGEIVNDWPEATATYFTINPIDGKNASRVGGFSANTLRHKPRTTRDGDVTHRNLYLIDLDPVRPSGVCSTDDEKRAAYATGLRIREYLKSENFPDPVTVDSGNGYHLYYRGDRCNPASDQWKRLLSYLNQTFGGERVHVDTSVHNAARVSRLPGTWNRKGPNTPDRPHRLSMVVRYPDKFESLDHGKIYRLVDKVGFTPAQTGGVSELPPLVDDVDEALDEFLTDYEGYLDVAGTFERNGTKYYALRECPFAGRAHTGGIGKSCITLSDTAVGFSCFSDDCADYTFADLRRHLVTVSGHASDVEFYESEKYTDEDASELEDLWGMAPYDDNDDDAPLTIERMLEIVGAA